MPHSQLSAHNQNKRKTCSVHVIFNMMVPHDCTGTVPRNQDVCGTGSFFTLSLIIAVRTNVISPATQPDLHFYITHTFCSL